MKGNKYILPVLGLIFVILGFLLDRAFPEKDVEFLVKTGDIAQAMLHLGTAVFVFSLLPLVWKAVADCFPGTALGISAVFTLGCYCFVCFVGCFLFTRPSAHPLRLPGSVLLGFVCLAGWTGLLAQYALKRKQSFSVPALAADLLAAVVYCPLSFHLLAAADTFLTPYIRQIFR